MSDSTNLKTRLSRLSQHFITRKPAPPFPPLPPLPPLPIAGAGASLSQLPTVAARSVTPAPIPVRVRGSVHVRPCSPLLAPIMHLDDAPTSASDAASAYDPDARTPYPYRIDLDEYAATPMPSPMPLLQAESGPRSVPLLKRFSTYASPKPKPPKSPKKAPPPPPLDLESVRRAYPPKPLEREAEAEAERAGPEFRDVTVNITVNPGNPASRDEHSRGNAYTHTRDDDPLPVPHISTRGDGYRYPSWNPEVKPGDVVPSQWAASRSGDLGNSVLDKVMLNVLDEIALTPRPAPPPPPQPSYSQRSAVASAAGAAARTARRTSRQVVNYVRSVNVPLARPPRRDVDVEAGSNTEHGWEMRPKKVHFSIPSPTWTRAGDVDDTRVTTKVVEARRAKVQKTNRRKRQICLVLFVLALLGIIIGLCVGLLRKGGAEAAGSDSGGSAPGSATFSSSSASQSTPATSSSSSSPAKSASAVSKCLADFSTSTPQSYPCGTCTPALVTQPNDFTTVGNMTGVGEALQLCALMDILGVSDISGWGKGMDVCKWEGIGCDARGRVQVMNTTGTMGHVPPTIQHLVSLTSLVIAGNTTHPDGKLPNEIGKLRNLTDLEVTNTRLVADIPNFDFGVLSRLDTVVFANNTMMGDQMPDVSDLNVSTYVVSGQGLKNVTMSALPSSVRSLDLSLNKLEGTPPTFSDLQLTSLNLEYNNFTHAPTFFSPDLAFLSLRGNPGMVGAMPAEVCSSKVLQECYLTGTKVTGPVATVGNVTAAAKTCGVCKF